MIILWDYTKLPK